MSKVRVHESIRSPGAARAMTFRASLGSACALAAMAIGITGRGAAAAETFVFHHEDVMGTSMELRLMADSEPFARRAAGRGRPLDCSAWLVREPGCPVHKD